MSNLPRRASNAQHTIVLRSMRPTAPDALIIGPKQRHFSYARGSPPDPPQPVARGPTRPPFQPPDRRGAWQEEPTPREGNLLERFGVDSGPGRMVARVLVMLLLMQPVTVAFGMELESGTTTPATIASVDDTTTPASDGDATDVATPSFDETAQATTETNATTDAADSADVAATPTDDGTNSDAATDTTSSTTTDTTDDLLTAVAAGGDTATDTLSSESDDATMSTSTDTDNVDTDTATTSKEDVAVASSTDEGTEATTTSATSTPDGDGTGSSSGGGSSDSTVDDTDTGTTTSPLDDTASTTSATSSDEIVDTEATTTAATTTDTTDTQEDIQEATSSASAVTEEDTASTTELLTDEVQTAEASSTATTTEQVDATGTPVLIAQNPDSKYVFGEGDCTVVADGQYYCVTAGPETQVTGDPRVYAERDRDGDREIFYFDGTKVKRITNNSYDDFAPVFDEETGRIVWQAMINDRLQIMLYEIPTNTTRQITTGRENSSNPDIAGDTVVWQQWIDTNWEILMTNVHNHGAPFTIERLTDNAVHDMFPAAYDNLITWQSERAGSWEVVVYDLATGNRHTLEKSDNTKYENPRFVLLFDSRHDNGDVETVGYNLDTGEMMELGTRAKPQPVVPVSPKEKSPDALPREAASSTSTIKEGLAGSGSGNDDVVL